MKKRVVAALVTVGLAASLAAVAIADADWRQELQPHTTAGPLPFTPVGGVMCRSINGTAYTIESVGENAADFYYERPRHSPILRAMYRDGWFANVSTVPMSCEAYGR